MHPIAIFGITGRMGQTLLHSLRDSTNFRLCGAIASATSTRVGHEAAAAGEPTGVLITADAAAGVRDAAVAVDFSLGASVAAHAQACAAAGVPILIGATGFDAASRRSLEEAAREIAVLIAPNTSVGANVVAALAFLAASRLGLDYDVEIFDAHHRMKRDAPSGTALALGQEVAKSRGQKFAEVATVECRPGPRIAGSIGFSSLRAGDLIGEHTVTFAADGERVEITHRATDRITFARGALRAAGWLVGRAAGLYGMADVLGP